MRELVKRIKEYTEAGIILNHMHLFDRLEDYFAPMKSCTNCIYWMEDIGLCSNSVVTNLYSDVEVKDNWCELWRSKDEVIDEIQEGICDMTSIQRKEFFRLIDEFEDDLVIRKIDTTE